MGTPRLVTQAGSAPLVDAFTHGIADMIDLHLSVVFGALHSEDNYLEFGFAKILSVERRTRELRSPQVIGSTKLRDVLRI
ncbi:hypothetical protein Syun_015383 [Stephania yunnanensis]|uniref:Uncharacterized protein n=1 Tax=Stephania yunnanensis TaxID=152371 RepID=A0AAP0JMS4_9MAGN